MSKTKITIKTILGKVIWESEKETLKEAVLEKYDIDADLCDANLRNADLRNADLRGANLYGADLHGADLYDADLHGAKLYDADLYGANLYGANLHNANLDGANLRGANLHNANLHNANLNGAKLYGANLHGADLCGANLCGANLYGANLYKLPVDFINQCSRDILFILSCLKSEVPYLKQSIIDGKVDGSTYEGDCACLVGTLAHGKDTDKVCESIPFYVKGIHNMGETFFLNIKKGDTPENNEFSAHVLKLIEMFESGNLYTITYKEPN